MFCGTLGYKYAKEKNMANVWEAAVSQAKHSLKIVVFYMIVASKTRLFKTSWLFLTPHLLTINTVAEERNNG